MNSSDHPSAYGHRPFDASGYKQPWQPPHEDTLNAGLVEIERKSFSIALKENPRGRFLRITEKSGMKHATIIVPAPGLKDFQKMFADMIEADAQAAPKNPV